ncbi:MAG: EamA family transporter [Rhodothermales bacterium]
MIELILAVCCHLSIGMIFKHAARWHLDRMALLTANYAAALLVAVAFLGINTQRVVGALSPSLGLLALALATGALFIAGFFVFAWATEIAGMSLAIGVMRVSVVIPFLASWGLWGEVPTPAQGVGLGLAGAAFFLIARRDDTVPSDTAGPSGRGSLFGVLALLFCAGGLVDVSMKTFDAVFAENNSRTLFILLLFGVAFLMGLGFVIRTRRRHGIWPDRATLGWGALLGLFNYGSVEFFLRAISKLSGPFVFPVNNIALVIGAALLGVYVWGERLTGVNWLGLGLAAGALVLLSL